MAKGSSFEREIATQLSLWWSGGTRDDLIWRTAGSGGRATMRRRRGKGTANAAGDLAPTDPIAQPLFDYLSFECKRGYNKFLITDLVDRPDNAAMGGWDLWYQQAKASQKESGACRWALIHKRDKRPTMIYFHPALLRGEHPTVLQKFPSITELNDKCVTVNGLVRLGKQYLRVQIAGVQLSTFLEDVKPEAIKMMLSLHQKKK